MKAAMIAAPTALLIAVLLFGVPAPLPGQSAPAAAPTRVCIVSAQRILTESKMGQAELSRIQGAQSQRVAALRTLQQAVETTRAQVAKGGDPATMAKLQQQEQQQRLELERATVQANNELQTLQRQLLTDLQNKIKPIVEQVAKARGFEIVLNADSSVVWGTPTVDITTAVIEGINAQ